MRAAAPGHAALMLGFGGFTAAQLREAVRRLRSVLDGFVA
jgi:hypothetical protein